MEQKPTIIIADDQDSGLYVLRELLANQGYRLIMARDGMETLKKASEFVPDLVLLDVMMPGIVGFEVCKRLRNDPELAEIPVIMVTALNDRQSRVRGLESGANDFISKPVDRIELLARVGTAVEYNLRRRETLDKLQESIAEAERLLQNTMPESVVQRLRETSDIFADRFDEVSILFADIAGFTKLAARISPTVLVRMLNEIFSSFDNLSEKHGVEKIKTVGDKYMVASGLPEPRQDHAESIAELALDIQAEVPRLNARFRGILDEPLKIRIGINSGPVVAGVIGVKKYIYDLWGDTVNVASRMEKVCPEGGVQVTEATYRHLKGKYILKRRGPMRVKSKGWMKGYLLKQRRSVTKKSRRSSYKETAESQSSITGVSTDIGVKWSS